MKGSQREPRARLVDALDGAETPDVTGRHKDIFSPERATLLVSQKGRSHPTAPTCVA